MSELVVVFPAREEFERCCRALVAAAASFRAVEPPLEVADVAAPCVVIADAARAALHAALEQGTVMAGQVPYREPLADALADLGPRPPADEDAVGRIAIVLVAPCIRAPDELRLTAQVQGDLAPAMPYLNAECRGGTFNPAGPTFTFMDGPRLVSLYPHRIVIGRLREMQDAWRTLKAIKNTVNDVWSRRGAIRPSYERRAAVSALEVYSRLPKTNCGRCGEASCLAFAAKLVGGLQRLESCRPLFEGEFEDLRAALVDLVSGLGA